MEGEEEVSCVHPGFLVCPTREIVVPTVEMGCLKEEPVGGPGNRGLQFGIVRGLWNVPGPMCSTEVWRSGKALGLMVGAHCMQAEGSQGHHLSLH